MKLEGMNPAVKYVPFPAEAMRSAAHLEDKDRLRLYDAICKLGFTGEYEDLSDNPILEVIFTMAAPTVAERVECAVNGAKGGRPRKKQQ